MSQEASNVGPVSNISYALVLPSTVRRCRCHRSCCRHRLRSLVDVILLVIVV